MSMKSLIERERSLHLQSKATVLLDIGPETAAFPLFFWNRVSNVFPAYGI